MKVLLDEQGFVTSFAYEGDLVDSMEIAEPTDLGHFGVHFSAYRVRDGDLVFDEQKQEALAISEQRSQYRMRREAECFSVINRGQLWYDTLTNAQREELRRWYQSWLDGTDTRTVPEKPTWLN